MNILLLCVENSEFQEFAEEKLHPPQLLAIQIKRGCRYTTPLTPNGIVKICMVNYLFIFPSWMTLSGNKIYLTHELFKQLKIYDRKLQLWLAAEFKI